MTQSQFSNQSTLNTSINMGALKTICKDTKAPVKDSQPFIFGAQQQDTFHSFLNPFPKQSEGDKGRPASALISPEKGREGTSNTSGPSASIFNFKPSYFTNLSGFSSLVNVTADAPKSPIFATSNTMTPAVFKLVEGSLAYSTLFKQ